MSTTPTNSVSPPAPVLGARGPSAGFDPSADPSAPSAATPAASPSNPAPAAAAASSQLKLVVAKADAGLAYTYTLVDQITGRVVAEIPHQAAEAAAARPDYTAGEVVDTHA